MAVLQKGLGRRGRGETGLCFMLLHAMTNTIASAPGPAVSGKGNRDSDALNENEQMFHSQFASLYNG